MIPIKVKENITRVPFLAFESISFALCSPSAWYWPIKMLSLYQFSNLKNTATHCFKIIPHMETLMLEYKFFAIIFFNLYNKTEWHTFDVL